MRKSNAQLWRIPLSCIARIIEGDTPQRPVSRFFVGTLGD